MLMRVVREDEDVKISAERAAVKPNGIYEGAETSVERAVG
jgi:hypothetical protein